MAMNHIVLFLHILAAVTWIGGLIFLATIGPLMRSMSQEGGSKFLHQIGKRFKYTSWIAVVVLLTTGIENLRFLGAFSNFGAFMQANPAMLWKLILVIVMVIIKILHDFVIGPKAKELLKMPGGKDTSTWKASIYLGRANMILGIIVLYLAVMVTG